METSEQVRTPIRWTDHWVGSDGQRYWTLLDAKSTPVLACRDTPNEDVLTMIANAVNAYGDLVAACEACLYALDLSIEGEGPSSKIAVKCVRAALAKARGEGVTT